MKECVREDSAFAHSCTSGVKHVNLQDEWCETKSAYRTCGVKPAGLQDVCCEAGRLPGRVVRSSQDEWCEA